MDLLAEDLMLLASDDDGAVAEGWDLDYMLAGSVLADLVLRGAVVLQVRNDRDTDPHVVPTGVTHLDDPLLVSTLDAITRKNEKCSDILEALSSRLRKDLLTRLRAKGMVDEQTERFLKIFPHSVWRLTSTVHRDHLRARITEKLRSGRGLDVRGAAALSLLDTVGRLDHGLDFRAASREELLAAATRVAQQSSAGGPVSQSLDVVLTAASTAVSVALGAASATATGAASS